MANNSGKLKIKHLFKFYLCKTCVLNHVDGMTLCEQSDIRIS